MADNKTLYKSVSMSKLIYQGLAIEQKIAELDNQEDIKMPEISPIYSLGVFEDLLFDDLDQIVSFCYLEHGVLLPISKFEYIGNMGYMTNVIKEQNSMGQTRYYSYVDDTSFYLYDEEEAVLNKLVTWHHINGNISRLYDKFKKKGAPVKNDTSKKVLQLKNN